MNTSENEMRNKENNLYNFYHDYAMPAQTAKLVYAGSIIGTVYLIASSNYVSALYIGVPIICAAKIIDEALTTRKEKKETAIRLKKNAHQFKTKKLTLHK